MLENICAIHLHRLYEDKVYFYNRNIEVDFYLPEQSMAIQVCYDLKDVVTVERETQALETLAEFADLRHLVIVTRDEERTITLQAGKIIRVVPVWKWLME